MAENKSTEYPLTYEDYTDLARSYLIGSKEYFLMAAEEMNAVMKIDLRMQALHLQLQAVYLLEEMNRLRRGML